MKCANCGAELKVGCIYCSVCGKEAQIVSDYNLLEDDFLRDMLKEREEKIRKETAAKVSAKEAARKEPLQNSDRQTGKTGGHKRRVKKRIIFAVLAMILLVILIVSTVLLVKHSRENSYDYQMEQAANSMEERNYRAAEKYVMRALELEEGSLTARQLLAEIYVQQGEERKAAALLEEICEEDKKNRDAYQRLIELYAKEKEYESIQSLSEKAEDEDVLELFSEYLPGMPEFDTQEGKYAQEFSVGISADEEEHIYYSVDGTDPRQGAKYQGPIPIGAGKTVRIRAIAKNQYDLYGDEIDGQFQVELQKPQKPRVSPSGGSFYSAQDITVTAPEGCRVYYTWDGTVPDTDSAQYTQPIAMPEGNNILSLIAVDGYGMSSDVLKCNYIYMPAVQNTAPSE